MMTSPSLADLGCGWEHAATAASVARDFIDMEQRQPEAARLVRLLETGPEAASFGTGLWLLPQVRQAIEQHFGARFGTLRVWQLLQGLGFSPQHPATRARQRDEAAIELWKRKRWPELNESCRRRTGDHVHRRVWTERTSPAGAYLGTACAKPGAAVQLQLKHLSVIAGISYSQLSFRLCPGTNCCAPIVEFLGPLRRQVGGKPLIIWDRLAARRGHRVRDYVAASGSFHRMQSRPAPHTAFWQQAELAF